MKTIGSYSYYLVFALICVLGLVECINAPDYSDTPSISFIGFSKNTLVQGFNSDTLILSIGFKDGDGDIGFGNQSGENIFLTDNRTGDVFDRFRIPSIPEEGANNGVAGEINMVLLTTCCIFPDNIPNCEKPEQYPTNDLSFTIYIVDRAGNKSNSIVTPDITLFCQ
ncbi:MAG: hypothetical protein V3V14_07110 [Saprospiraceae bacterium]